MIPKIWVKYKHYLPEENINIFGAKGDEIFFCIDRIVGCYDITDPQNLQLKEFRNQGYSSNCIIYDDPKAYLPLGNYGLWIKTFAH